MRLVSLVVCLLSAAALAGRAAAAAQARAPLELGQVLSQLPGHSAAESVERLAREAASDPAARVVAAVAADPALLETRRADLAALVGAGQLPALAAAAVSLQLEARGDETLLRQLAAAAGDTISDSLDAARAFDGEGSPAGMIAAARVWQSPGETSAPSVRALTAAGGRLLVNGAVAERLAPSSARDGVARERVAHPDDETVYLDVRHSASSLEAYDANSEAAQRFLPLGEAGAAPRLLEHGEASIPGKGKVYFLARELVEGVRLADLPAEARPLDEVAKLFDRLLAAGLALDVPGPDLSWLLSRVVVGSTASGGRRAYLLDGRFRRLGPQELAAHDGTLRAMLKNAARAAADAAAPARAKGLGTILGGAAAKTKLYVAAAPGQQLEDVLSRHGLAGAKPAGEHGAGHRVVELGSEKAVRELAPRLLADPAVARVSAHPAVGGGAGPAALLSPARLISLLPEGLRSAAVAAVPEALYARMTPEETLAVLKLAASAGAVEAGPPQAWARLSLAQALTLGRPDDPAALERWVSSGPEALGAPGAIDGLTKALKRLDSSKERADVLAAIPGLSYARLSSAGKLALLEFARSNGGLAGLAGAVWDGVRLADLAKRFESWSNSDCVAALVRWLERNASRVGEDGSAPRDLLAALEAITSDSSRDQALTAVPESVWAGLSPADRAALIGLVDDREAVARLPDAAWRGLGQAELKRAMDGRGERRRIVVLSRWLAVEGGTPAGRAGAAASFAAWVEGLSRDSETDAFIALIPAPVYEAMAPADRLTIIKKTSDASAMGRLPGAVWRGLAASDVVAMASGWGSQSRALASMRWIENNDAPGPADKLALIAKSPDLAAMEKLPPTIWRGVRLAELSQAAKPWSGDREHAAIRLWSAANADLLGADGAAPSDLVAWLLRLSADSDRDNVVLALPEALWARLGSGEALALISGMSAVSAAERLPAAAWRGVSLVDLARRLPQSGKTSRPVALKRWLEHAGPAAAGAETPFSGALLIQAFDTLPQPEAAVAVSLIPSAIWARLDETEAAALLSKVAVTSAHHAAKARWIEARKAVGKPAERELSARDAALGLLKAVAKTQGEGTPLDGLLKILTR